MKTAKQAYEAVEANRKARGYSEEEDWMERVLEAKGGYKRERKPKTIEEELSIFEEAVEKSIRKEFFSGMFLSCDKENFGEFKSIVEGEYGYKIKNVEEKRFHYDYGFSFELDETRELRYQEFMNKHLYNNEA
jgi:hypothetical protein